MSCAILRLPFPPSVNRLWRYVQGRAIKSREYREWLAIARAGFFVQGESKVEGPYAMHIMVNKPDNRRRDLSNTIKAVEDAIVAHGYVEDDSLCQRLVIEWVRGQADPVKVFITQTAER